MSHDDTDSAVTKLLDELEKLLDQDPSAAYLLIVKHQSVEPDSSMHHIRSACTDRHRFLAFLTSELYTSITSDGILYSAVKESMGLAERIAMFSKNEDNTNPTIQ